MPDSPKPAWWQPRVHVARRGVLRTRGEIATATRAFFVAGGFVEVETSALQVSPGNEAHLHAFATDLVGPDGRSDRLYLHTSPEFACKKLLAAGEARIFTFGHVFRNRERGPLHHPEFTMLEWYRVREPYEAVVADALVLLAQAASIAGAASLRWRGKVCDPFAVAERLTVAQAFDRFAGIDLMATVDDRERLAHAAVNAGVRVAADDTWSDIFSKVLVGVEPQLGIGRPTVLYEYPSVAAALAQPKADDPRVAERFELYACGVELANGFGELNDAAEQRRRFEAEMAEKQRVYGERYPIDEAFLSALSQMPAASGVAMGFDRLVLLATGAQDITDVIWTPVVDPHGE